MSLTLPLFNYMAGNPISCNNDTFIYNPAGHLARIETANQTIEYLYNAQGQRTLKHITETGVQPNTETVTAYIYDLQGLLIAELDEQGNILTEYAYLNGQPLSQINTANAEVFYYHNDHLGTLEFLRFCIQLLRGDWTSLATLDTLKTPAEIIKVMSCIAA